MLVIGKFDRLSRLVWAVTLYSLILVTWHTENNLRMLEDYISGASALPLTANPGQVNYY